jgi:hypothetical protein
MGIVRPVRAEDSVYGVAVGARLSLAQLPELDACCVRRRDEGFRGSLLARTLLSTPSDRSRFRSSAGLQLGTDASTR